MYWAPSATADCWLLDNASPFPAAPQHEAEDKLPICVVVDNKAAAMQAGQRYQAVYTGLCLSLRE